MTPCVNLENSYRSYHSPVVLYCKINNNVNIVNITIHDVKIQNSCPVYNADNLNLENDTIQFTIKDKTFMDILFTEIRRKTISYATFK